MLKIASVVPPVSIAMPRQSPLEVSKKSIVLRSGWISSVTYTQLRQKAPRIGLAKAVHQLLTTETLLSNWNQEHPYHLALAFETSDVQHTYTPPRRLVAYLMTTLLVPLLQTGQPVECSTYAQVVFCRCI